MNEQFSQTVSVTQPRLNSEMSFPVLALSELKIKTRLNKLFVIKSTLLTHLSMALINRFQKYIIIVLRYYG